MTPLTREQIELVRSITHKYIAGLRITATDVGLDGSPVIDQLCDMALRACDAPEVAKDAERYRWLTGGDDLRGEEWAAYKDARDRLLPRLPVMGKGAVDAAIDAAMQAGRKHD